MSKNETKGVVTVVYVDDTQSHSEHLVKGTYAQVDQIGTLLISGDDSELAVFAPGSWVSAQIRTTKED